jgi:hypothetical protein
VAGKIRKFLQLEPTLKIMLLEAFIFLTISKMVLIFPMKKITARLGKINEIVKDKLSQSDEIQLQQIKFGITAAGNNLLWKSHCLDQALAAVLMMRRRRIYYNFYLGVKKNEKNSKLDAHAWVVCGENIVVGGEKSRSYDVVAIFSRDFSNDKTIA